MLKLVFVLLAVSGISSVLAITFYFLSLEEPKKIRDEPFTEIQLTVSEKNGHYSYVFKTCGGKNGIQNPVIVVSSEKEERIIRLVKSLEPYECSITGTRIKTSEPNAVALSLSSEMRSQIVTELTEESRNELRSILLKKNQELNALIDSDEPDRNEKINKLTQEIFKIREELGRVKIIPK